MWWFEIVTWVVGLMTCICLILVYCKNTPVVILTTPPADVASVGANINVRMICPTELDGVSLQVGYRVLLKDQRHSGENGLWLKSARNDWRRDPSPLVEGAMILVRRGRQNKDSTWVARRLSPQEFYFLPIQEHLQPHPVLNQTAPVPRPPTTEQLIPTLLHTQTRTQRWPGFVTRFWTPEEMSALIKVFFHDWEGWFHKAQSISRLDVFRWLALFTEGGFWVDPSVPDPVTPPPTNARLVLFQDENKLIDHRCIGLTQRHPFVHFMLNYIRQHKVINTKKSDQVSRLTGRHAVSYVYRKFGVDCPDTLLLERFFT